MNKSITNLIELSDRLDLNAHDDVEQELKNAFHALIKDETHLQRAEEVAVQFGEKHLHRISTEYKQELVRWFNRSTGPWMNNFIYCLFFHDPQWFRMLEIDDEMVMQYAGPWVRPMLNLANTGAAMGHAGLADIIQAWHNDEDRLKLFEKINKIRMKQIPFFQVN